MAETTISKNYADHFSSVPAHLWIGNPEAIRIYLIKKLQNIFCQNNGCTTCITCQSIYQKQHYAITWFTPEKQYTRELLSPLFEQLSFALNENEHYFFILEHVDFMPPSCANSLLKSLEEPPSGYYFLLSAERAAYILPTIRSRCMIHELNYKEPQNNHRLLFDYFTSSTLYDPFAFSKELDESNINERTSIELLDSLLAYWMQKAKDAIGKKNHTNYHEAQRFIALISSAMKKPPMPGSSKIFWRDLFLQTRQE